MRQPSLTSKSKLFLKILASILFGIFLLECTLRLVGMGPPPVRERPKENVDVADFSMKDLAYHAYRNGWINEPNSSTPIDFHGEAKNISLVRNWLGIREDDQTPVEPNPNQTRIMVLGDSHTDGFVPNSKSYPNLLEKSLGPAFDVVNCAQGASSPYDQLWAYQKVFHRLKPEFLIVGFYAGNDYIDLMNQHHNSFLTWDGKQFVRARKTGRPDLSLNHKNATWLDLICQKSAIFFSLRNAGLIPATKEPIRSQRPKEYFDLLFKAREVDPAAVWQGLNQAFFFSNCPDEWDLASRKMEFVLDEFKTVAPRDGLLFVIIPSYRQIKPESVAEAASVLGLTDQALAMDERICDDAKRLLTKAGIPFIDLRLVMKESNEKLYWDFDHHINDVAHKLIADQLESRLKQMLPGLKTK